MTRERGLPLQELDDARAGPYAGRTMTFALRTWWTWRVERGGSLR
jgi:hypothetical protein